MQEELGLDDGQLRSLVAALPQLLGLDFDAEVRKRARRPVASRVCVLRQSPRCSSLRRQVAPKLAALRTESDSGFCRAELAAKVLARPTLLLGLEEACPPCSARVAGQAALAHAW